MSLSVKQHLLLSAKIVEFRLPFSLGRMPARTALWLTSDPRSLRDRDIGLILLHVPKSAVTSIVDTLFGRKSRHVPVSRPAVHDEQRFENALKFTLVRNHWSRIHSAYHYLHRLVGNGDKFVDWILATHYLAKTLTVEFVVLPLRDWRYWRDVKRYVHCRDQVEWIPIPGRRMVMNFIGRYESLEADFGHVCEMLSRSDLTLQQLRPRERLGLPGYVYKRDSGCCVGYLSKRHRCVRV